MKILPVLTFFLSSSLLFSTPNFADDWRTFDAPNQSDIVKTYDLWATHFHTEMENLRHDPGGTPLIDKNNESLDFQLAYRDWCITALEGSAIIQKDGERHVINFLDALGPTQIDCEKVFEKKIEEKPSFIDTVRAMEKSRFFVADKEAIYGHGQRGWYLAPLRTIAVDPNVIPLGSIVYIPTISGLSAELPNGAEVTHDGYFFAGDTGGDIDGLHIDIFEGVYDRNPFPNVITSDEMGVFEGHIVKNDVVEAYLKEIHGVR